MASFSPRDLYGGAITANLPTDFIDSSNLRQIPDHQEVYLAPKTLTTIIFEINQYVSPFTTASRTEIDPSIIINNNNTTPSTREAGSSENEATTTTTTSSDKAAALYHLRDLIDPRDTLTIVSTPRSVRVQSPSLRGMPALIVRGKLTTTREVERRAPSLLPEEYHHHAPEVVQTSTTIRLLVVRMEGKETDLCVAVNVPWKELEGGGGAGVEEEESFADGVVESIVASLDVKDFGLFGE